MSHLVTTPIPARAGIGLRSHHYREILEAPPPVAWMETHPENYFGEGGMALRILERIRTQYPLSFHGVGLSLGSTDPIDRAHLGKLQTLIDRFAPTFVSEHLSWSSVDGQSLNELLPFPFNEESLTIVCEKVDEVQTILKRPLLIENVTRYLTWRDSTIPEGEFMAEVVRQTSLGFCWSQQSLCQCREFSFGPGEASRRNSTMPFVRSIWPLRSDRACLLDTHGQPVYQKSGVSTSGPFITSVAPDPD